MIVTNPWGLLALLSLPLILGLHFFRNRRQTQRVGGLHLWEFAKIRQPVGRRFQRLIRSLPLLLQLLIAILLSLLIAGVDIPRESQRKHFTIIVDTSVSMSARNEDGLSSSKSIRDAFANWAKDKNRYTLISAGARPGILAGPFADRTEAINKLSDWQPEDVACDLEAAINLAEKFITGEQKILFLTDDFSVVQYRESILETLAIGQPMDNVGIDFADRVRISPEKDRIHITIQSYSSLEITTMLRAYSAEHEVFSKEISLTPSKPVSLSFETAGLQHTLDIKIDDDSLMADNQVTLVPVPPIEVIVSILELDSISSSLTRAIRAVPFTKIVSDPNAADIVFTDLISYTPRTANTRVCLFLDAQKTSETQIVLGRDIVRDHHHPVSSAIDLTGVIWPHAYWATVAGPKLPPALRQRTLASSGPNPLLVFSEYQDGKGAYLLNLAWESTNIYRTAAWPTLIQAILEECRQAMPGLLRSNFRSGENVLLRPDNNIVGPYRLMLDGELIDIYDEPPELLVDLAVGDYLLLAADDQNLAEFRVNLFASEESDLRARKSAEPDFESLKPDALEARETNIPIYYLCLLAIITMLGVSWIFYDTSL